MIIDKHKIKGSYESWDRYFNTLYYLVREDFYRSLRVNYSSVKDRIFENKNNYNDLKNLISNIEKEYRDMYFYTNTNIEKIDVTINGINMLISFDLSKKTSRFGKKRMLFGNLLILTHTDFNSILRVTVSKNPLDLAKDKSFKAPSKLKYYCEVKVLDVELVSGNFYDFAYNNKSLNMYIIETKAFYESYSHLLKKLQDTDLQDLPFKDVLVNLNFINSRDFLRNNYYKYEQGTYKLKFREQTLDLTDRVLFDKSVSWLDDSQKNALFYGLTNKLAIIQGPPGTGKTFIGSLLTEILLQNTTKPILVVCYTNHALDQFLTQILKFEDKIVRVGGRCQTEELKSKNLMEIKKNHVYKKNDSMFYLQQKLYKKNQDIKFYRDQLINSGVHSSIKLNVEFLNNNFSTLKRLIVDNFYYSIEDLIKKAKIPANKQPLKLKDEVNKMMKYFLDKFYFDISENCVLEAFQNKSKFEKIVKSLNESFKDTRDFIEKSSENNKSHEFCLKIIEFTYDKLFNYFSQIYETFEIKGKESNSQLNDSDYQDNNNVEVYDSESEDEYDEENKLENEERREYYKDNDEDVESNQDADDDNFEHFNNIQDPDEIMILITRKVSILQLQYDDWWLMNNNTKKELIQLIKQYSQLVSKNGLIEKIKKFIDAVNMKNSLQSEKDLFFLKQAKVIGMTTTGSCKYSELLKCLDFGSVIIEEAAEVFESHVAALLKPGIQHIVMIGDHKQLRPKPYNYEIAKKFNYEISMFERLIMNNFPLKMLSFQRRMKPEFADFVRIIYNEGQNAYKDHESTLSKDPHKGLVQSMFLFQHESKESEDSGLASKTNTKECEYIIELTNYLLKQNIDTEKITILATYLGQVLLIRKRLNEMHLGNVRVSSVDNYQGEENDYILLSLVRSNRDNNIGFLKEYNRVCVAFSRAKIGFYVFGNFVSYALYEQFQIKRNIIQSKDNSIWTDVLKMAQKKNIHNTDIKLICNQHKNVTIVIDPIDFRKSKEGGCDKKCEARLDCGHICKYNCHNFKHEKSQCRENCGLLLKCGHPCKNLCGKVCSECNVDVKVRFSCQHINSIKCSQLDKLKDLKCASECSKTLTCGHKCKSLCYQECDDNKCEEKVEVVLQCGHVGTKKCNANIYEVKCEKPCNMNLPCGHECKGKCYDCLSGTLHIPCEKKCEKILLCNHVCKLKCGNPCICEETCENVCVHGYCPKSCFESCPPCLEDCIYHCEIHKVKCEKKCFEKCEKFCELPCTKKLICGHNCIGICSEECIDICRICDPKNEIFEIMFGKEDEPDSMFYKLDCNHIYEYTALKRLVEEQSTSKSIKIPSCPNCKVSIFSKKSLRFYNIIKTNLENIQFIKKKVIRGVGNYLQTIINFKEILPNINSTIEEIKSKFKGMDYNALKINNLDLKAAEEQQKLYKNAEEILQIKNLKPENLEMDYYNDYCDKNFLQLISVYNIVILSKSMFYLKAFNEKNKVISSIYKKSISNLIKLFSFQIKGLEKYFNKNSLSITYSDGFLKALASKLLCLKSFVLFYDYVEKNSILNSNIDSILKDYETSKFNLSEDQIKTVESYTEKLSREEIKSLMSLVQDATRWYQCPKGHFYSVGNCGGPMEVSTCPECGSSIGGRNHQSEQGNISANI